MVVEERELDRRFVVASWDSTLVEVLRQIVESGGDESWYVLVRQDAASFGVLRVRELLQRFESGDLTAPTLGDFVFELGSCPAVEREALAIEQVREARAGHGPALVVTSGGEVAGLVDDAATLPGALVNLAAILAGLLQVPPAGLPQAAPGGMPSLPQAARPAPVLGDEGDAGRSHDFGFEDEEDQAIPTQPGNRRGFDEAPAPQAAAEPPPPAEAPVPPSRYLNVAVEDHDPAQPLAPSQPFTLAFRLDLEQRQGIIFPDERVFAEGEEVAELTVHLTSNDFHVLTRDPQHLIVPRSGPSWNKARFDLRPKKERFADRRKEEGPPTVTALFYKDNNFIQGMRITLNVGEAGRPPIAGVESLGRPPDGAFALQPREVSILIRKDDGKFALTMTQSGAAAEAHLPISLQQLDQMMARVRQALTDILYLGVDPKGAVRDARKQNPSDPDSCLVERVYLTRIIIPEPVNREALRILARAGYLLYRDLFFGPAADKQTQEVGKRLRQLAERDTLKIQIVSQEFLFSWGVLYLADGFDPNDVQPERFLGLKHIIEQLPLQPDMPVVPRQIASQPQLNVSLNLNTGIDAQFNVTVIKDQRAYWERISQGGNAQVIIRETGKELKEALNSATTPDQILYFYGHGVSCNLANQDASYLSLGDGQNVTYGDLCAEAPLEGRRLPNAPLVFLNACESAELSPLFYGGFMPYFTQRGARGMIGTECVTPVAFAAKWAERFFDCFLEGDRSLGEVFLSLRREFFFESHNLLGLLYALYCDADTQVVPGLRLADPIEGAQP
jgi:hypothetical protein